MKLKRYRKVNTTTTASKKPLLQRLRNHPPSLIANEALFGYGRIENEMKDIKPFMHALKTWVHEQEDISALALVGSYARARTTETSDVDIMLKRKMCKAIGGTVAIILSSARLAAMSNYAITANCTSIIVTSKKKGLHE